MGKDTCLIIGSGLGGLACGYLLARCGYGVTVLEQGRQAGGCLQSFRRGDAVFETGMHFVGSAAPGQLLHRLLSAMEVLPGVQLAPLDTAGYNVISLGGRRFRIAGGQEAFVETLCRDFPDSRADLERYAGLIRSIAAATSLHSLFTKDTDLSLLTDYQTRSMDSVLRATVADPLLRHVLAGNLPLYAARRGRTPFSLHAFITDFYQQSAFRIVGGSQQIAESLVNSIVRRGGRVLTGKQVTAIDCDGERATGATTADGGHYAADYFISDIHPAATLGLLHTPLIRPAYRRRVCALPNTTSCFVAYLRYKKGAVPYQPYNFFSYKETTPWDCESYDETTWPKGYLYMHGCHEPNPRFARYGMVISYMGMDDVQAWAQTSTGRRGADYEAFKRRKASRLLDCVARDFPGLRAGIEAVYTSTPLTYRDFTGTPGGSMYGIAPDLTLGAGGRVSYRTRIPNLLLTGQSTNSHGILGTLIGALQTCSALPGAAHIPDFFS